MAQRSGGFQPPKKRRSRSSTCDWPLHPPIQRKNDHPVLNPSSDAQFKKKKSCNARERVRKGLLPSDVRGRERAKDGFACPELAFRFRSRGSDTWSRQCRRDHTVASVDTQPVYPCLRQLVPFESPHRRRTLIRRHPNGRGHLMT